MSSKSDFGFRFRICAVNWMILLLSFTVTSAIAQTQNDENGLSKQFTESAITAMVSIHQVKESIATVVSKNLPGAYYDPHLASRAELDVRTTQLQATTSDDQQTAAMLNSYFSKLRNWGLKYKSARESMNGTNTTSEKFLENDADWQAILACEKGLNAMLTARSYNDIASCH